MKKKFLALVMCVCMCLTLFTGCSLFTKKSTLTSDTVIAKLYNKEITYADLQSKYSTYSNYFAYYDQDIVMQLIYEEVYLSAMREIKAKETVVLYQEDIDDIVEEITDEIVKLVGEYEKTFITNANKTVPDRLNTDDDKTTEVATYKEYTFEPAEVITYDETLKGTDPNFTTFLTDVKNKVFENIESENMVYRTNAWNKYAGALRTNYKFSGKTYTADEAVIETLKAAYEQAYTNKQCDKYREYVESRVFGDKTYSQLVADVAFQTEIVNKYKELLSTDMQQNTLEDNYTEVVCSTENEDLILYHYNGEFTFFTVEHILVKFSDEQLAELKTYEGYDSAKYEMFRAEYEAAREALANLATTTYRDDEGKNIQTEKRDENNEIVYKTDDDGNLVYDDQNNAIPVMVDAKITIAEIKAKYEQELADLIARQTETPTNEQLVYLRTNLFNQFVYSYTADNANLSKDLTINTIGYAINTDFDDDCGLMAEFAEAGRNLYAHYNAGTFAIGEELTVAYTDYGAHLMMLSGVYSTGELVTTTGRTDAQIFADLQTTKFSNFTQRTLLEYVYGILQTEKLKTEYSQHLYELLDAAEQDGKFVKYLTPSYEDLA